MMPHDSHTDTFQWEFVVVVVVGECRNCAVNSRSVDGERIEERVLGVVEWRVVPRRPK